MHFEVIFPTTVFEVKFSAIRKNMLLHLKYSPKYQPMLIVALNPHETFGWNRIGDRTAPDEASNLSDSMSLFPQAYCQRVRP